MAANRPMYRLFQYLGNYPRGVWTSVSSSIVNKIFDLMPPFLTAWIIDTASGQTPAWLSSWTGTGEAWHIIQFLAILTVAIFDTVKYRCMLLKVFLAIQFRRIFLPSRQGTTV